MDVRLTAREFSLISHLVANSGRVQSRDALLENVWGPEFGGDRKTVDVHVSWLRRKLGENAVEPRYLHTVRGVGIKLEAPTG